MANFQYYEISFWRVDELSERDRFVTKNSIISTSSVNNTLDSDEVCLVNTNNLVFVSPEIQSKQHAVIVLDENENPMIAPLIKCKHVASIKESSTVVLDRLCCKYNIDKIDTIMAFPFDEFEEFEYSTPWDIIEIINNYQPQKFTEQDTILVSVSLIK